MRNNFFARTKELAGMQFCGLREEFDDFHIKHPPLHLCKSTYSNIVCITKNEHDSLRSSLVNKNIVYCSAPHNDQNVAMLYRVLRAPFIPANNRSSSHDILVERIAGCNRMKVKKLCDDLMQCWLAKALMQVLERASTRNYVLISMGDVTIAEQGNVLSELMKGFLRQGETNANSISAEYYAHVNNLEELHQWTALSADTTASLNGGLFVVYAPYKDDIAAKHVRSILAVTSTLEQSWKETVLLVLHNPTMLMGLEMRWKTMTTSPMYYLGLFGATETSTRTRSDWQRRLKFIAQPLDWLRIQCGWKFVLEIVRWVSKPVKHGVNEEETFGAARATMFSSINKLPFQLLLFALKWSHFHPQLVRACAGKFQRQIQLIPQVRIRRELVEMQRREIQLWSRLYSLVEAMEERCVWKEELSSSVPILNAISRSQIPSPKLARLSKCCLWDTQKQFYKDQGIRAWSSGAIPFGVSSSSFLAASYARIAIDFLLSNADSIQPYVTNKSRLPNCFVWEAASGSCKFLHSFMLHFTELMETHDEFKSQKLVPLVIATDLSDHVLRSRLQMPCFRTFIERGQLDFALFDTQEFVHRNATVSGTRKTLELLHLKRQWHVGSDGPVVLMGNYFLDSLRADIFTVATSRDHSPAPNAHEAHARDDRSTDRIVMQVALLDETTSTIAEMDISLHSVADSQTRAIYDDDRLNAILLQVLDQFRSSIPASVSSTGLIVFPVEAFEFFLTLLDRDSRAEALPIAILAGDARFSFQDAISSPCITTASNKIQAKEGFTDKVSLELPQLSPHPDCFCLPVDFEIIKMFFEQLNRDATGISASTELIASPASDTFDVFFAVVEPQRQKSGGDRENDISTLFTKAHHISFKQQFAIFTPGDCDLLWGMMTFDNGARCFSTNTLLAILAQTGWDFDLFEVLQWELLGRLRRQKVDIRQSLRYQNILVEAGLKSWRTFYHMEQRSELDITMRKTRLQLARWFYELEANDSVLEILTPWRAKACQDISVDDVAIFYLLGRTSVRMNEHWNALSFFRLCARLVPTKLKFQRQVARTLLVLQTLRSASSCINACDSNETWALRYSTGT